MRVLVLAAVLLVIAACSSGHEDYTVVGKRIETINVGSRSLPTYILDITVRGETHNVTYLVGSGCYADAKIGDVLSLGCR